MKVLFLGKSKHATHPIFSRFIQLGLSRGHDVELCDKKTFLATDLRDVDVLCLKSHYDVERVWTKIDSTPLRVVNRRAATDLCAQRLELDLFLKESGIQTPRNASTPTDVTRLTYPIMQKSLRSSSHDVSILSEPSPAIDCNRYFYQEMVPTDGILYKVYCVGEMAFLLHGRTTRSGLVDQDRLHWQEMQMPDHLSDTIREIGRAMKLEVYGLDFVGQDEDLFLIDVNPFPGFIGLPRAADALWDYLEAK